MDGIAGRITADPVCPQERACAFPAPWDFWLWFGEGTFGMPLENATLWLGIENMNMGALHGEGKITSGENSRSNSCMEDPPCASHWLPACSHVKVRQKQQLFLQG